MTPQLLTQQAPIAVRFKRCPACGDIALLSSPICSCCDRTFVTTARYARQRMVSEVSSALAPTPYLYSNNDEFVVLSQRPPTRSELYKYNPLSIVAAALGLGWLGMILNGQTLKGVAVGSLFLVWAVCAYLVASSSPVMLLFTTISGVGGYLVALTDVICISSKLKKEQPIHDWDWF